MKKLKTLHIRDCIKKHDTYAEIINKTLEHSLQVDKRVIVFGLGATDPKGIFSTTLGLRKIWF